jgi:hypothetical protein
LNIYSTKHKIIDSNDKKLSEEPTGSGTTTTKNCEEVINRFLNTHDQEYSQFFERIEKLRRSNVSRDRQESSVERSNLMQPASSTGSKSQSKFWQDFQMTVTPTNNYNATLKFNRPQSILVESVAKE